MTRGISGRSVSGLSIATLSLLASLSLLGSRDARADGSLRVGEAVTPVWQAAEQPVLGGGTGLLARFVPVEPLDAESVLTIAGEPIMQVAVADRNTVYLTALDGLVVQIKRLDVRSGETTAITESAVFSRSPSSGSISTL